jgi:hypothetical protein
MTPISETVSENKRGRPRRHPRELIATLRIVYPELTTERSLQNYHYMVKAFDAIHEDPALVEQMLAWKRGGLPRLILEYLGRTWTAPGPIRANMKYIIDHDCTVKAAKTYIQGRALDAIRKALEALP